MEPNDSLAYRQRNQVFQKILLIVVALAIGFGGGLAYDDYGSRGLDATKPEEADLTSFWQVWNLLRDNYVDSDMLKADALISGAIEGLVEGVGDPYTAFFPPKETKEFAEQIKGAFGGVGIEIGIRNEILTVIAPIKNTPADRAGILAGDTIFKIDDKSTEGMDVQKAVSLIRGEKGSTVTLTISRDGLKDVREVRLVRDTIKIPAVTWELKDGTIAYLQVHVFNQNVDREFHQAAVEITKSQATKIVLDLRNNPGGLLDSAVNLAGYFLDEGQTVIIERNGSEQVYRAERNALLKNYPVVILINKGSASASEILAGALRDNRNIALVGETSFGKGSVQNIFDLPHGASVKITIAKWFTPSGSSINDNGIVPSIAIERTEDDIKNDRDPQLDKALEIIKTL